MAVTKKMFDLSYDHMAGLKRLPIAQLPESFQFVPHILADTLWLQVGVESEDYDAAIEAHGLEQDPEYQVFEQEYKDKI